MDDTRRVELHGGPMDGKVADVSMGMMGYASVKVGDGYAIYEANGDSGTEGLHFIGTVDTERG